MPIITLTSDWGNKDHYVGSVKGAILNLIPNASIIDISHEIPAFNLYQASFILKNCYKNFPTNTIHIIGVNSIAAPDTPHTAILKDGHYFISSDNGIFSLLFDTLPDKIIEIKIIENTKSTFPARDIYAPAACFLAKGNPIEKLGIIKSSIKEMIEFQPVVANNTIRGMVIYIDRYFNAITNISLKLFNEVVNNKKFRISFTSYFIDKISKTYNEVTEGEILALFS